MVEQLICNQQVTGSNPVASSIRLKKGHLVSKKFVFFLFFLYAIIGYVEKGVNAHVAQLVEHFLGKGEVTGSNPVAGSKK